MLAGFSAAMSFPGSEDVIRFFADEELAETVEDKFTTVGFDLSQFFLFFFVPAPSSPSCWSSLSSWNSDLSAARRAEMADVEQVKKIVPFDTCEVAFGQNDCELLFGVDVPNLNLGVQINSVEQPIQCNSVRS